LKISAIEKIIGSGFLTGYIPFASGTFGSLAALFIYLIPGFENPTILLSLISFFTVIGIPIGSKFEKAYGKDPAECTIDEFVGTWIALLFIPKTFLYVFGAFFIWRILDIVKPFPARQIEKLRGGWGIMLDDVISGIYSLIIIHIVVFFTR
jgi:phosphatidylglycerophosphatase A